MTRIDGRNPDELRKVNIIREYLPHAEGSVFFELGNTRIICTASVEDKVPAFIRGTGQGWITAEYAMIPRATQTRTIRESSRGKIGGRTHEIQRLIGRSLRAVVNLKELGEMTVWIDCDVIHADGGTRTAAITGSYVALYDALRKIYENGRISSFPIKEFVAATSVGIVNNALCLDLCFQEDVKAQVDMNMVMTESGKLIEVQGTAEGDPFAREELNHLIDLAEKGILELIEYQKSALNVNELSLKYKND
ncbi:MAG: ribonuclease PH [Actinobacteria bacterium]|nr:ribonuclease PH [Actinomycetota bacterium]